MTEEVIIGLLIALVIFFLLFLLLRELNTWYWKINERIVLQKKTNSLLEQISRQLGGLDQEEITIKEIATGKIRKVKKSEWEDLKLKNPTKSSGYIVIEEIPPSEKV